ncbi:F-box/kelch-repeat protein At3g23880-like [Apium graveolens]|uniref:F-box/kelch-repeat protein At3g23880-like n=1 Tax=Apium graveolens TaxID=4045 RepID=UPI003D79212B
MASINHLSQELIFNILTFLPVFSLLRCKAVCKSWKSIISDPHFVQDHLTVSHNKPPRPFSLLIVIPTGALEGFYLETPGENTVKLTLPDFMYGMHIHVCCCNGLVILADIKVRVLYIWNPLTRLFKLLPKSNIFRSCLNLIYANEFGFWFDSVNNDYKILRVMYGNFTNGVDHIYVMAAGVYSVNSDSWREIPVPNEMRGFRSVAFSKRVVGRDALYFEEKDRIVSFDLYNEVFGFCQYPDSGERMSYILNFDDSLGLIMKSGGEGAALSLWKLDGFGDNVTWTKMFNIEPDVKIDRVFMYLGDAQFLAQDSDIGFFIYDDKKKKNKTPLARPFQGCISAVQFTGSLVSLKGFERHE